MLVHDNLSTHTPASLYTAFPAPEALRLVNRFEWLYTPKHGSWLDMAELHIIGFIEIDELAVRGCRSPRAATGRRTNPIPLTTDFGPWALSSCGALVQLKTPGDGFNLEGGENRQMHITRLLTGIVIAVLVSTDSGVAGAFEDCAAAYNRQEYAEALRLCRPLAEQGDAKAQSNLGLMYAQGQGVAQDKSFAHMWLSLAAA